MAMFNKVISKKKNSWFFLSSLVIGLRRLQLVKIHSAVKKMFKIIIRKLKHFCKGLTLKMYPAPWLKIKARVFKTIVYCIAQPFEEDDAFLRSRNEGRKIIICSVLHLCMLVCVLFN